MGPIEYARVIAKVDAPVQDIWGVVSAFGGVERWIAGARGCVLEGAGVGAVRTVELAGRSVRERLDALDSASHALSYSILAPHALPASDVCATIRLRALGPAATEFSWISHASRIDGDIDALRARIEGFYRASIDNLARLLGDQ